MKMLKYSNICLFKSLKTRYQCITCKEAFTNISSLRLHCAKHKDEGKTLSGNIYRSVDISSLECKLCSEKVYDLTKLTFHLKKVHGIEFSSIEHMFIPYRLEEGFKCVICEQAFKTFVSLSKHMNKHSNNHVCEHCGMSFYNSLGLRTHKDINHKERFKKCKVCGENFLKNYTKFKHMQEVHNLGSKIRRYCMLCDETFQYSYNLEEHKIQKHGEKRPVSNCSMCDKTFLTPNNLKIHIRSVHIRERNFVCDVCGASFFTKHDQMRHKRRHEDVKSFSCSHCDARFKTKDSWRRHQKRQHGQALNFDNNK